MKKGIVLTVLAAMAMSAQAVLPYQNKNLTAEERARDLVGRLTLEEKAMLMQHESRAVERLGIQPYNWWNEALHGVARAGKATMYPQAIGMGASMDDALLYKIFSAVSDEARVKNRIARRNNSYKIYQGLTFWTPNVNLFRDPRWGRGQETYGEDPYLTSVMGCAVVRGIQGPSDAKVDKAHACAKHFAVHSGPEWNRHVFNAENISSRDLWETYLPAFKSLVCDAGVKEVMCAYNRYEGKPCCGSDRLLQQILRDDWAYKGLVVTDCWAMNDFFTKGSHATHPDTESAVGDAVLSGADLECGSSYKMLPKAVREGKIQEKDLDKALLRLLTARYKLGVMDESSPWDTIPESVLCSAEHKKLSLTMARESMVLLQNKNNTLPLKAGLKVALIGPNANDSVMQWGNYFGTPVHTETLLEAMRKRLPEGSLVYVPACGHTENTYFSSMLDQCKTKQGKGFAAAYCNSKDFDKAKAMRVQNVTTPFNYTTAGATVFAPGVNLKNFSAEYETKFKVQKTGTVVIRMACTGGYELYVGGKKVAEFEGKDNKLSDVYTFTAKKNKTYDIKLCYKHSGTRVAQLKFDMGEIVPTDVASLVKSVADCDVVVFAGGISPLLEGEEMAVDAPGFNGGDRTDIELPAVQRELISALKAAGKSVVLVNYSGSAVGLVPESKNCDAILQAWYPGQEGGTAVADVLFGDYNPAGRLPVTFYKNVAQIPDFEDYSMKGRTYRYMKEEPLFPFGYGLSYTTFSYGAVKMDEKGVTVPVTNTGNRDGEDVVQLYIKKVDDKEGPNKTLRGFKRVKVAAGATVEVVFPLDEKTYSLWDTNSNTMNVVPGEYYLYYGGSSRDSDLTRARLTLDEQE